MFRPIPIRQRVQPTPRAFQDPLLMEEGEVPRVNAEFDKVSRAKDPLRLDQGHELGGFGRMCGHSESIG